MKTYSVLMNKNSAENEMRYKKKKKYILKINENKNSESRNCSEK